MVYSQGVITIRKGDKAEQIKKMCSTETLLLGYLN